MVLVAALCAPLISPQDPLAQDLMSGRLPPVWSPDAAPGFWLGTDSLGRDVLSRIIWGARIALIVAFVAGTLTATVGSALGLIAGYYRGWADRLISRLVDIWMAFPPVLFAILLIAVLGPGLLSIIIAIVVIDWTRFARVIRAEAMNQGAMDYVASAQVAGMPRGRIMLAEILPTIVALLSLEMGISVIVEAILSFVNLSISTDQPTWGGMIAEGRLSIHQAWWVLVFPLITLFLTVLSFSQFGEGLKDRFDPVLR